MSAKNDQANMSLVGHLREIRNRIALSVTALVVAFIACFAIIKPLANAPLFIDDTPANVEGAIRCGLLGHVFDGDTSTLARRIAELTA